MEGLVDITDRVSIPGGVVSIFLRKEGLCGVRGEQEPICPADTAMLHRRGRSGARMPTSRDVEQRDVNTRFIYKAADSEQTSTKMQSVQKTGLLICTSSLEPPYVTPAR